MIKCFEVAQPIQEWSICPTSTFYFKDVYRHVAIRCGFKPFWHRSRDLWSYLYSRPIDGRCSGWGLCFMFFGCKIRHTTPDSSEHRIPIPFGFCSLPAQDPIQGETLLPSKVCLPSPKSMVTMTALLLSDGAAEKLAQRQFSFQSSNMKSAPLLRKWTHCFPAKSSSVKGKRENEAGRRLGWGERVREVENKTLIAFFFSSSFWIFQLSLTGLSEWTVFSWDALRKVERAYWKIRSYFVALDLT